VRIKGQANISNTVVGIYYRLSDWEEDVNEVVKTHLDTFTYNLPTLGNLV